MARDFDIVHDGESIWHACTSALKLAEPTVTGAATSLEALLPPTYEFNELDEAFAHFCSIPFIFRVGQAKFAGQNGNFRPRKNRDDVVSRVYSSTKHVMGFTSLKYKV